MKKIAFISEMAGTKKQGGEHIAMIRTAQAIKDLGNEVDLYSYTSNHPDTKIKTIIPMKLRFLPFLRDILIAPFLGYKILKKLDKKYEMIYASTTTISSFYKTNKPLIIICHAIRSQKFEVLSRIPKYRLLFNPFVYKIISSLEKRSLSNAKAIIVIREHQKNFLIEKFGLDSNKISVIPNGIDSEFFHPLKVDKENRVIFVGRATYPKGFRTLTDAASDINAQILVVTQKADPSLYKIAKTKKNVSFKENATAAELVELYSASSLFVLPSLDEEQPLTVMEAMSCGLPVVVTTKSAADIVEDGKNGIVIEYNSPKELADSCNKLLKDKELALRMSIENRNKIVSEYSLKSTSKKILEIGNNL